jgi:hypothetical protein
MPPGMVREDALIAASAGDVFSSPGTKLADTTFSRWI